MTKAIKASEQGLRSHWKVRVVMPGAILHLASWSEPVEAGDGPGFEADWIEEADYGDTIGYLDWSQAAAVTWRYSP